MEKLPDGGPWFPSFYANMPEPNYGHNGMSLRDWFAGMALQGSLASASTQDAAEAITKAAEKQGKPIVEYICERAFIFADAMLKARE